MEAETSQKYAFANQDTLQFALSITGGVEPYAVNAAIEVNGAVVYTSQEVTETIHYVPTQFGVHTLKVTVKDAEGKSASAEASVPVAVQERESASD